MKRHCSKVWPECREAIGDRGGWGAFAPQCERTKGVGSHQNPHAEYQVGETGAAAGQTGHGARQTAHLPISHGYRDSLCL